MDKNQGYEIIKAVMLENGRGFALGHHPTAPSPYVTGFVIGRNRRWILRIICRRADHADDLSGLIIVDSDRTLSPIKCPVCFCADIGVQRHSDVFSSIV